MTPHTNRTVKTPVPLDMYDTYRILEHIAEDFGAGVEVLLFEYDNERSAETMARRIRHQQIATPGVWGARVKRVKKKDGTVGGRVIVRLEE